jgi:hypothetical protein
MVDVPPAKIGQASGSQSTVRQIGSALGIAVLGTALFTSVQSIGETKLEQTGYVQSIAAEQREGLVQEVSTVVVESAGGALPKLGEVTGGLGFKYGATAPISEAQSAEIVTAGNEAFTQGVHITGYFAAGFLLLGLLSTFSLGGGNASRRQMKDASPAKTASTEN